MGDPLYEKAVRVGSSGDCLELRDQCKSVVAVVNRPMLKSKVVNDEVYATTDFQWDETVKLFTAIPGVCRVIGCSRVDPYLRVAGMVLAELRTATARHGSMGSAHEAYGIIAEEFREFETEVFKKEKDRKPEDMRMELRQLAAMAMRALMDLELVDGQES